MDYLKLLEHSFKMASEQNQEISKFEYLSINIFDFTTYDGEMDALFAKKALEVCIAITEKNTFDYIRDHDNYKWYLIMVNMPFFNKKLEWGTSIRGAWWDCYGNKKLELSSCGLYENEEQILEPLKFDEGEWTTFVKAMAAFIESGNDT